MGRGWVEGKRHRRSFAPVFRFLALFLKKKRLWGKIYPVKIFNNAALRIILVYAVFSALWILFSDRMLLVYFKEPEILTRIQSFKGWVFVFVTAVIIYFLLHREIRKQNEAIAALDLYRSRLEDLVRDRTRTLEQEIAERQLAEKKFRDLLEGAPDAMTLVDTEGRILLVNRQMEKLFGYDKGELPGRNIEILIPEHYREKHRRHIVEYFAEFRSRPMGAQLAIYALTKDGKEFPADISLSPLDTKEGRFALADIRDITERKMIEEKIRKSYYFENTINAVLNISLEPRSLDDQLERILDLILAIPLLSLEQQGSIFLVEAQEDVLVLKVQRGYDREVLTSCARVPFGSCMCGEAAKTASLVFADCLADCHKNYEGIFPHGHFCVPIVSGSKVLGVLNLVLREGHQRDDREMEFLSSVAATLAGIIERRKAEEEKERLRQQLVEEEKLSALGRMLAAVAHEIRNPLTAVGGLVRRLEKKIPDNSKEKEYARIILAESSRLEGILRSVLTFTKEPVRDFAAEDLNRIIEESLHSVAEDCADKSIAVRTAFAELPPVSVAREMVREMIDNLLANALYATPAGGTITLATDREQLDGTPWATVKITDTGEGVPEELRDRIFEPFFTTKPVGPGHGIGLGLSIARKIMEEHGGRIVVEGMAGEGTVVSLYFPLSGGPDIADKEPSLDER